MSSPVHKWLENSLDSGERQVEVGRTFYLSIFYGNCMFMFVNVYSSFVNAFCLVSICFEWTYRLNALSVHWTLSLVHPTLDATMASVQRPEVHCPIFSFVQYFIHLLLVCPCEIQPVLFHLSHVSIITASGLKICFLLWVFILK